MAMQTFFEDDADLSIIQSRCVSVIGYDSQAMAHAHNLRESGVEVVVGLTADADGRQQAEEDGFPVLSLADATEWADLVMVMLPDSEQRKLFPSDIAPHLDDGDALFFSHASSVHFGLVQPKDTVTVAMVAAQAPGDIVRQQFIDGKGAPCLIAVEQDPRGDARELALSYAAALGAARAGVLETTFKDEAVSDLFGAQVVQCGGLESLITGAFDVLVSAGYPPELAYFTCVHEVKEVVDLVFQRGLSGMYEVVPDTAEFGGYVAGPRVIDKNVENRMRDVLGDIEDGAFTRRLTEDQKSGGEELRRLRRDAAQHPVEKIGQDMRRLMSWVPQLSDEKNS